MLHCAGEEYLCIDRLLLSHKERHAFDVLIYQVINSKQTFQHSTIAGIHEIKERKTQQGRQRRVVTKQNAMEFAQLPSLSPLQGENCPVVALNCQLIAGHSEMQ